MLHTTPRSQPAVSRLRSDGTLRPAFQWLRGRSARFALAATCIAAASPAGATRVERSVEGQLVDVRVLVDGQRSTLYSQDSEWNGRRYFQAFAGRHYALELRNRSSDRIAVLIAVDGLNVISGERSALDRHEPMYVLDPHERTVIRGWRSSLDDVREFVFVDEERSYAEGTGQANGDMGWIRVLTFEEAHRWFGPDTRYRDRRSDQDSWSRDTRKSKPEPATPPQLENRAEKSGGESDDSPRADAEQFRKPSERSRSFPGTGWGDRRQDRVTRTQFDPVSTPTDHLVLRYEYASGLYELGLLPHGWPRLAERDQGEFGFARPPRW